jgi:hypothetical protein
MMDRRTKSHQAHPNLLPLRVELILAQKGLPPRPLQGATTDEVRALELIGRMRSEYNKPLPARCWKDSSGLGMFNLQKVMDSYAG